MPQMLRCCLACFAACSGLALVAAVAVPAGAGAVVRVPSAPPAPVITSTGRNVYVNGSATNLVGTPGRFTFSDPGGSGVVGYLYGFSNPAPVIPVPAGAAGTATLGITPYSVSEFALYVSAKNSAGQISPPSLFRIETILPAGNIAALAWWKLAAGRGASAADATGHGHIAKLSGPASLRCGAATAPDGYRCWLSLAGSGGQAVTPKTVLPIVGNNGSFTASAWVKATGCAAACVAVSEDATQTGGFTLGYQRSCTAAGQTGPCWLFAMPATDSASAFAYQAASPPGTAHTGTWTQLTGVFEPAKVNPDPGCSVNCIGALSLYVNGALAGQYWGAEPWAAPASGPVRLGGVLPGAPASSWTGQISNVCIFYGPLQPADVRLLHSGSPAYPHNGCAALHAKYP